MVLSVAATRLSRSRLLGTTDISGAAGSCPNTGALTLRDCRHDREPLHLNVTDRGGAISCALLPQDTAPVIIRLSSQPTIAVMSAPDLVARATTVAPEDAPAVDLSVKKQVRNLLELNQVIIIRHGEKTPADPVNLSKPGEVRANHLPAFLLEKDSPWKRPDVIYAMKQSGPKGSRRPLETVLPLAEALKIAVNEGLLCSFSVSTGGINQDKTLYNNLYQHQSKALVESILDGSHRGKTVLISWEHKVEVDIAHHLGIPVKGWGLDPFNRNDGSNFTAMWVLTPGGESVTFEVFKEFEVDLETLEVTFPDKKQKSLDTRHYASHELREFMKHYKKDVAQSNLQELTVLTTG